MNAPASLTLFLLALHAAPAIRADEAVPDERLLAGEIVARESRDDAAGAGAHMQVLMQAPPKAVWEVIVSCELAFAWVDGLQTCEVVQDTGARAVVHQVVDQGWLSPTYDFEFESLRQPYRRIDVHLLSGNLRVLDARWLFEASQGRTLVDYEVTIQPSLPAPRFLVRRNLTRGIPDMLACIRALAGGSGSAGNERRDLDRCPGPLPAPRR